MDAVLSNQKSSPTDVAKSSFASIRYRAYPLRRPILTAAMVGAASVVALDRRTGEDMSHYHGRVLHVVDVVDGDTLYLTNNDRVRSTVCIRLLGVDSPELGRNGHDDDPFALQASAFTRREMLSRSVRMALDSNRTRDRYGRLLAYVYDVEEGRCFNEELVRSGHAYADSRYPHPLARRFLEVEARARKYEQGLWGEVTSEQWPAWKWDGESEIFSRVEP